MGEARKPVIVGASALKHELASDYIARMWYDSS